MAVVDPAGLTVVSAPAGPDQVKGTGQHESSSGAGDYVSADSLAAYGAASPELGVLAARIAGTVALHEPGWRLPRGSVLARRFGVKPQEVAAAVDQLADRRLVRELRDGEVVRVSPAEYHIPLAAQTGLRARVTPVGGPLECKSQSLSRLPLREDVAHALGAAAGEDGCGLRRTYSVGDEPAALSTTYAVASLSSVVEELAAADSPGLLPPVSQECQADPVLTAGYLALQLEFQQPSPGIASLLHLRAGARAITITATAGDGPTTLTVVTLRPDLFRVTIESSQTPLPDQVVDGYSTGWAHVSGPWQI